MTQRRHRCGLGTRPAALTLAEVILAFGILTVGVLTLIGYMTTIHRAAREGKNQAMATMHARSILEKIRDSQLDFDQAATPKGYLEIRHDVLLKGETRLENNEAGRKSSTTFDCQAKAMPMSAGVHSLVVRVA